VIVDAHHHLFPGPNPHYPGDRYLVPELAADTASVPGLAATVYVQARNAYTEDAPPELAPVGETAWVAGLGNRPGLLDRIVGFADLTLGAAVEPVLEAHRSAGDGRFAGVRHPAAWIDDPAFPDAGYPPRPGLLASFDAGLRVLHRMGLTFETWIYQPQIPEFTALARAHPDGVLILDHLGAPLDTGPRRTDTLAAWRRDMAELATCPNVLVKLGGLGIPSLTAAGRLPGDAEAIAAHWGPEVRWCIDTFGPDRCMFESNFPVDARLCDYPTLWAAYDLITAGYSPSEREQLFHRTAETAYGLHLTVPG
jgi:predicted TIM-barrel fold metal-dependent hydrolase